MSIFAVDNGILIIDRPVIRAIPEFEKILKRSNPCEGDFDGKKKLQAHREFLYIYYMYDFSSPHAILGDEDRFLKAYRDSKIAEGYKFPANYNKERGFREGKHDQDLLDAIARYKELQLQEAVTYRILISLQQGLNVTDGAIKLITSKISNFIDKVNKQFSLVNNLPVGVDVMEKPEIPDIGTLISDVTTLINLSASIPKAISTIDTLKDKVNAEKGKGNKASGGKDIGNREDPRYLDNN